MFIYDIARKVNGYRKLRRKNAAGRYLSPVRRIERCAPLSSGKYVAMTFDDGPSAMPPNPKPLRTYEHEGLSDILLDILQNYNAKGTFDVIGTTEHNYPDKMGKTHDFSWSGVKYDHYPDFGQDSLAGVKNRLEIAERMIKEGHELSNHGYKHVLFGPMKLVYGKREYFSTLKDVIDDLSTLHNLVLKKLNYEMKLSRPPHYIDNIKGGFTSYDAYAYVGYQYLAASFDGGGWKPTTGDYSKDIDIMVQPLEEALTKDPDILNGQIIFQKDGCNMSRQTPVADALDRHLSLLTQAGYKVITVSELMSLSPFEDLNDSDPVFNSVRHLANEGFCIGYKNNTFQPDRLLSKGEFVTMVTPPDKLMKYCRESLDISSKPSPYSGGIKWASTQKWFDSVINSKSLNPDEPMSVKDFEKYLEFVSAGTNIHWSISDSGKLGKPASNPAHLRRRDVMNALAGLTNKRT